MAQSITPIASSTNSLHTTSTQSADAYSGILQHSQGVQSNEKTNIFKSSGASAVWLTKAIKNALNAITKWFLSLVNRIIGRTPLIDAIKQENMQALHALIQNPTTNFNERNKKRETPLIYSVRRGNYEAVDAMKTVKGLDANAQDDWGNTALICAVSADHSGECVKLLLKYTGIDANIKGIKGKTALMYAVLYKRSIETINTLLNSKDLDVNIQDDQKKTALMYAAFYGNSEYVERLLELEDIDVNLKDEMGNTALIYAIISDNKKCTKLISEFIASKNSNTSAPTPAANENDQTSSAEAVEKESVQS